MASLSEKLRRERELRGISLKQISDDTKIGVRFLEALEEDRLELIPGDFYRRSYLRAYARYLGLDEDRAVNAYEFAHRAQKPEGDDKEEESSRGATWLPWVVLALVITAIVLMFTRPRPELESPGSPGSTPSNRGAGGSLGPVATAAAGTVSGDRSSEASSVEAAPALTGPSASSSSPSPLHLVVTVTESCWLQIEADGEIVTTGLKENGFRQELTAGGEFRLWLGNAGGVSFSVNDRPMRSLGRVGQVRKDVAITRDNWLDFVSEGSDVP